MTWGSRHFSYQFHHFGRIVLDLSAKEEPLKVAFETDQTTIDRVWFEMERLLQVGSIVGEGWCGDGSWLKSRRCLLPLFPLGLAPDHKMAQITEIIANGRLSQIFFNA